MIEVVGSHLHNYFLDLNLEFLWDIDDGKIDKVVDTYLFTSDHVTATSIIDHFVCNNPVQQAITEAGVVHEPDNLSNHSPIFVKLVTNDLNTNIERSY